MRVMHVASMHDGTARTKGTARKPTTKARVVLMLDESVDRDLRVLAAMQDRSKSSLVEEFVGRAVAEEEARSGKAA